MSNSSVRVTVLSDKGKWKRRQDEYFAYLSSDDLSIESSQGTILVLADGQGGNINSNLCAKISVESLINLYQEEDSQKTVEDRLKACFQSVHQAIKDKAETYNTPGMVSALTAIVIQENGLWIAQVGGNSVFLINTKNELEKLETETQSLIGQEGLIVPSIQSRTITLGIRILFVTDGITSQLSLETITKACSYGSPSSIIQHLIQQGNEAGGNDNMTVGLVEIGKFNKKTKTVVEKNTVIKRKKTTNPTINKSLVAFLVWLLIFCLILGGIYIVTKFYPRLQVYLEQNFLTGNKKQLNEVVVKPSKIPNVTEEVAESSLLVSITPSIADVFFYEGEVPLNEKQKIPYFASKNTPTIIKGLQIGIYTLIVGKEGYEPIRQVIQIKKTDLSLQLPITLTLKQREKNVEKTNTEPITKPEEIIQPKPPVQNSADAEVLNELTILSDPSGAKVFVNGVNTGLITPTVLKRGKGVYLIQVIKDGYESASRSVEFSGEGNKQTINLIQKALLVKVSITSQPSGAKIYLDNSFTSLYTPATISLSIGSHTIMVGKAGFEEQAIDIVVKPGVPLQPVFFTLKHKPGVNRVSGNMVMPYEN